MSVESQLFSSLRAALPPQPGIAVIHSSFSKLMPPSGFQPFDAVRAVHRLVSEGWTIALPAFTFGFCGGAPFRLGETSSEVGPLADWVRLGMPAARRTRHPIYSFVVVGPRASEILACESVTTFGAGSPFEFFEESNAQLVMLGCGWTYCTQFHRYEELAEVSYRFFKTFEGDTDTGKGGGPVRAQMYVRDLEIDAQNDFGPAVAALRESGEIKSVDLWRGGIESVAAADLARVCRAQLKANELAYVSNASEVAAAAAHRRARDAQEELKVAILGRSNVELLRAALETTLSAHFPDRTVLIHTVPFGQLDQALLSPGSELRLFDAEYTVFADRLEDLIQAASLDGVTANQLGPRVEAYADAIANYRATSRGWLFVCLFAPLQPNGQSAWEARQLIDQMNAILIDRLAGLAQCTWIDIAHESAMSNASACDMRLWHLGRFPYSHAFSDRIARRVTGLVLAASGRTARLVVLDLDNTMWGGVLGEDGLQGIRLGGDYPGNAFKALQRSLKRLSERGIALAVSSKNDTDLALKAIDEHPEMEIRASDLVAHRINWQPKSDGIRSICEELNLGLASALFVDDNPVEREIVRRNLPDVKVIDLPRDPAEYASALLSSPWLAVIDVTDEDRRRVEGYRARAVVEARRQSAANLEDFYAGLGMTLYLQPLDDGNIARAAQLCKKTNQFNTTTRRYEAADLQAMDAAGDDVVVVGLSDNVSGRENIGLLILRSHPSLPDAGMVDLFLLSCRVLGRGLESAIMAWAVERANSRNWRTLYGTIIETERNTPVRSVFKDAGFEAVAEPGEWRRDTAQPTRMPAWLTIDDAVSKRGVDSELLRS